MRRLRILHCCPSPSFSGLEQYALLTATRQKNLGHEVAFIVQAGSALEKECAAIGLRSLAVDTGSRVPVSLQYASLLRSECRFDVLHLHSTQDIDRFWIAFNILRLTSFVRPKVIQQNHIWPSHSKKDPLHWITYKVADEIWCSSARAKASLETLLPVPPRKIHVVNYGRDLSLADHFLTRSEAREKLGVSDHDLVIGAISRLDPAKGVGELVYAAAECLRRGHNFTLVVIGGPTESHAPAVAMAQKLKQEIAAMPENIRTRLKLVGSIPNAGNLLRAFDLYAQGSYKETFSLALLDAQLAGLPVIGTSSGGTPEVVVENKTGWLAQPESLDSMIETFERALRDRERWPAYGASAQARVKAEFSLETVTSRILERYVQEASI